MTQISFYLANEQETVLVGKQFGKLLYESTIIFLEGELGAGKTTFCKGVLAAFDYSGKVKSPTYTLVEPYEVGDKQIYHFDLYRLGDPEELEFIGIRDYFDSNSIALIEWWQKGSGYIPSPNFTVSLNSMNQGRKLEIKTNSSIELKIIEQMYEMKELEALLI